MKVAKETGSQALEADALHYMSDIFSSAAVLLGLGFVWIGWPKGDAVAALFVAVVVLSAAWHLGKNAVEVLIDTAPDGIAEQVAATAQEFEAIVAVEHVRARPAGNVIFAEILIRVSRTLSLETLRDLRARFTARLREAMPTIDVRVKAEPLMLDDETVGETVRTVAARHGLLVHEINLRETAGRQYLSFDVEIDEDLPIRTAHDLATALEQAIAEDLGPGVEIVTHIDPRRSRPSAGRDLTAAEAAPIAAIIESLARSIPTLRGIHHLRVGQNDEGLQIAFHCLFDDHLSLRDAHHATAQLEQQVLGAVPDCALPIASIRSS